MFRKRKPAPDPMSVVSRFIEAANHHDTPGIMACVHPQFESIQPLFPSRNFKGAEQVRRNWEAIFRDEPGFRLTVLRSAIADPTQVWVELHGAGDHTQVGGVFILGIEDDLIRWVRIFTGPIEQRGDESEASVRQTSV
jgi:hypothetical protein